MQIRMKEKVTKNNIAKGLCLVQARGDELAADKFEELLLVAGNVGLADNGGLFHGVLGEALVQLGAGIAWD